MGGAARAIRVPLRLLPDRCGAEHPETKNSGLQSLSSSLHSLMLRPQPISFWALEQQDSVLRRQCQSSELWEREPLLLILFQVGIFRVLLGKRKSRSPGSCQCDWIFMDWVEGLITRVELRKGMGLVVSQFRKDVSPLIIG